MIRSGVNLCTVFDVWTANSVCHSILLSCRQIFLDLLWFNVIFSSKLSLFSFVVVVFYDLESTGNIISVIGCLFVGVGSYPTAATI